MYIQLCLLFLHVVPVESFQVSAQMKLKLSYMLLDCVVCFWIQLLLQNLTICVLLIPSSFYSIQLISTPIQLWIKRVTLSVPNVYVLIIVTNM